MWITYLHPDVHNCQVPKHMCANVAIYILPALCFISPDFAYIEKKVV